MPGNLRITRLAQQLETDDLVVLYELDASALGDNLYRFTSSAYATGPVSFGGNVYAPVPVESQGWEWSGQGPFPRPTITLANVNQIFGAAANAFDDLRGATLTRIRTFRRFLDDGADPDPEAVMPLDIYRVERKTSQTKVAITWELASVFDQEGVMLPRRQILQSACTHRYRVWDAAAGAFDYTRATCPYAGAASFTAAGVPTSAPNDRCGKRLSDCRLRFGSQPLPTRAFPGVARVRG
jgi:lambda family phage minor tail protein L